MKLSRTVPSLLLVLSAAAPVSAAQLLNQGPVWRAESNQRGAGLGSAVAAAGDVNGDGYGDLIVGAYAFDGDLQDEGAAFLFLGSKYGPAKLPAWSVEGDQAFANLGNSVASAGDVNGDGFADVIVGANGFDNHLGRATVYQGSAAGLPSVPSWTAQPGGREFGWSVASAGDVNGDGYDDVIVGEINFTGDQNSEGRVLVYHGSAAGLALTPAWIVEGNQPLSAFGNWVASAGDVNGDGFDDVLVGAPRWHDGQNNEGRAFLFLGSAAGLATTPAWSAEGDQPGALFGSWLATAGDVNGDGFADVIVSANGYANGETGEGAAFVYLGSPLGLGTSAAWRAEGNQFVALAGDVSSTDLDGDGFSDVLVGFYAFDHGQVNEGSVFAYYGSPAGLSTQRGWSAESDQTNSEFGFALAGAGDVNGDGFGDVLVGAYAFNHGQRDEGRAFAYLGASRQRLR